MANPLLKPQSSVVLIGPDDSCAVGLAVNQERQFGSGIWVNFIQMQDFGTFAADVDDFGPVPKCAIVDVGLIMRQHQFGPDIDVVPFLPSAFFSQTVELTADDDNAQRDQHERKAKGRKGLFAGERDGAQLFNERGCENCHRIAGYGGRRGPDLSTVGDRRTEEQLTIRILKGGTNMPAFGSTLTPDEVDALVAFLQSRTTNQ